MIPSLPCSLHRIAVNAEKECRPMQKGILNYFLRAQEHFSILDYLNHSSFDELVEINVKEDTFRFVYNVEGKYALPATTGSIRNFVRYVGTHHVHPEDQAAYLSFMDPDSMLERLDSSLVPGTLECTCRTRKDDASEWFWTNQVLLGGKAYDLPDGVVYWYIFDIQPILDREDGVSAVPAGDIVHLNAMTGLMEQRDFFDNAGKMLRESTDVWQITVIDIENFKLFNDWFGRLAGDKLLTDIGTYLKAEACDHGGLAGYLGSDDFCLLTKRDSIDYDQLFDRLHSLTARLGMSMGFLPAFGIASSEEVRAVLDLFDHASAAMQQAKADFKHRIRYFDPSLYQETEEDYRILSDFQQALKNNEITFYLQPQCLTATGQIVGAEALARWIRKQADGSETEIIPPSQYIPVLEKYGFVADLDQFIWEAVCKWISEGLDAGCPLVPVSVNVSPVDIFSINVVETFSNLVRRYSLPPNAVKIEITESACGEDPVKMKKVIRELRQRGFIVLLDDFGSGYSSLNMLHDLNVDVIKLDANFLHMDQETMEKGIHILESIINMTKTIGLPIIVEGVETVEQKEYLQGLGCRYVQGFYYHKPMTQYSFRRLIGNPANIDQRGFVFKANEQFRVREFLNDTVYSDSMLNNILGPTAIYSRSGDRVDIIRYNQQFYDAVNIPTFDERLDHIERYMPSEDHLLMLQLMDQAERDRLNGSSGVMTFFKPDGSSSRFLIHFYYVDETSDSKRFYGSAHNITQLTNLQNHMELLSQYFSDTVIFLKRSISGFQFEVAVNGLEAVLSMGIEKIQKEMDNGSFYARVPDSQRQRLCTLCVTSVRDGKPFTAHFNLRRDDGNLLNLYMRSDVVKDPASDVQCILTISRDQAEVESRG